MAAHSTFALIKEADAEAVVAARAGREPGDPKLAALYRFARSLVTKKGHVTDEETQALLDAGYSRRALDQGRIGPVQLIRYGRQQIDGAVELP
jgi:alkylhydroperoxidase family enzyme